MSEQRVAARRDTDQAHRAPRSHDAALATRGLGLVLMLGVGALGYWFSGSVLTSAQPVPLWATLWVVVVMLIGSLVAGIAGIVMLWMAGAPRAALAGAPHTRVGRAPRSAVLGLGVGVTTYCGEGVLTDGETAGAAVHPHSSPASAKVTTSRRTESA